MSEKVGDLARRNCMGWAHQTSTQAAEVCDGRESCTSALSVCLKYTATTRSRLDLEYTSSFLMCGNYYLCVLYSTLLLYFFPVNYVGLSSLMPETLHREPLP